MVCFCQCVSNHLTNIKHHGLILVAETSLLVFTVYSIDGLLVMQYLRVQSILEILICLDSQGNLITLALPAESFNKEDEGKLCSREYFRFTVAFTKFE